MKTHQPVPFLPGWPEPNSDLLEAVLPPAPVLPLDAALCPRSVAWIRNAAASKGAPVDYVFASMLTVAASVIGNTRWVHPWEGWAEPPIFWAMCIGLPSSGKSPAMDAVLKPLQAIERMQREAASQQLAEWQERNEVAKLEEQAWKSTVRAAINDDSPRPARPRACDPGPEPHVPRLIVNDGTIERLGDILSRQPRGTLQTRDELAGWMEGMQRYGGSSDRPFWLEAYGGRSFTVERMGRPPLTIDRLTIGVLGGIQPDRLKSLLFKGDDDGLLARFLPIWPEPAPIEMPGRFLDADHFEKILEKLMSLEMVDAGEGGPRPLMVYFSDAAKQAMLAFRHEVRAWEEMEEGLLLSFIGKLPGLAARLALVLAYLDWTASGGDQPHELAAEPFTRAVDLVRGYFLPMARRAYADAALPKAERAARRLVGIIREHGWQSFSSREVQRLCRKGLHDKQDLDTALKVLEEGDCIRKVEHPPSRKGGRPPRLYAVNPALHRKKE